MSNVQLLDDGQVFYETGTLSLVGGTSGFTGSSTLSYSRTGNVVTITTSLLTHASSADVNSGNIVLPASLRPTSLAQYNCYLGDLSDALYTVEIATSGRIRVLYRASGVSVTRTDSATSTTITYVIR